MRDWFTEILMKYRQGSNSKSNEIRDDETVAV